MRHPKEGVFLISAAFISGTRTIPAAAFATSAIKHHVTPSPSPPPPTTTTVFAQNVRTDDDCDAVAASKMQIEESM
jgi:hypothetical protein